MVRPKKGSKEELWAKEDIRKTIEIVKEAKEHRHPAIKFLDRIIFWIALTIAVIGNFVISIALIPFLMALRSIQLFIVIVVMGISFGVLFELLIRTIEHLETKHHIFLGILIPAIAIINIFIITLVSNNLERILKIDNPHNPWVVGIVYGIAFILPFILYKSFFEKRA